MHVHMYMYVSCFQVTMTFKRFFANKTKQPKHVTEDEVPNHDDDISQGGSETTDHENPQGGFDYDDEVHVHVYNIQYIVHVQIEDCSKLLTNVLSP